MVEVQPPRASAQRPGECVTIDDVIARMVSLGDRFESEHGVHDGVLCFNRLYLDVTRGVKQAVEQPAYFQDAAMVSQLDVRFAQLYFDALAAVDSGEPPALPWRLLFESRHKTAVLPIQFAVAGMNAHINHDLPIALVGQWEADGGRPANESAAHADYSKINQILKVEEKRQKAGLEPSLLRQFEALDDGQLGRLDDKLALWTVQDARAAAWDTARHLWDVRGLMPARKALSAAIGLTAGALGKLLLEPV